VVAPGTQRRPPAARADLGRQALALVAGTGEHDAPVEPVTGDDPAGLREDAATLRALLPARGAGAALSGRASRQRAAPWVAT
jgi:hypothetical protein